MFIIFMMLLYVGFFGYFITLGDKISSKTFKDFSQKYPLRLEE